SLFVVSLTIPPPPISTLFPYTTLFRSMVVFIGVCMLLLAWWRLGRLVRQPDGITVRELLGTMAWWAAPMLVTSPIFSRDVYSYRSEEHTSELQSRENLVCRLLLEKKKK